MGVGYYKVVLNGHCQGQDMRNILYYRTPEFTDWLTQLANVCDNLALLVRDEIWRYVYTPTAPYRLGGIMPNDYTLDSIDVYPYNDLFNLVNQLPYTLAVNEAGLSDDVHCGQSSYVVFRAVLEPTSPQNGIYPPKRGHLKIGPIAKSALQEDNRVSSSYLADLQTCADAFAQDLTWLTEGLVFYPIRVRPAMLPSGLFWAYADVDGFIAKPTVKMLSSRQAEA